MELARLEGHAELIRRLRALSGSKLRKVLKAASKEALRPMLATAKRLTPVKTGRLRASLGISAGIEKGEIMARLAPRKNFSFTSQAGEKRASGFGKKLAKAVAKGRKADVTPLVYARGIEFGFDKGGHLRRRRGPAHYLTQAFAGHSTQAMDALAAAIRKHLDRQSA